jgi:phosphoglycolate phosphatase
LVLGALAGPLALATAKQAEFTLPLLDHLGIAARFQVVCAACNSALSEPKRTIVARALRKLRAERPVVIGDTVFDVAAAHDNGADVIGVTWGIGERSELERAGADRIVEDPGELLVLLSSQVGDRCR